MLPPYLPGEKVATPPDDEVLQAAMNLAVGAEVPAAYRTLVREQTGIGPVEPLAPLDAARRLPRRDHRRRRDRRAGAPGCSTSSALTNFTVLEKNPEPGGTWWQNTYPGCRVDTPSLLY